MTFIKKLTMVALSVMMAQLPSFGQAKEKSSKKVIARAVRYDVPSGYQQLGTTDLFYRQSSESIDFIGRYNSQYYSSTYSDGGYKLAIKVGSDSPTTVDCVNGTSIGSITCNVTVVQQGDLGRVVYTVTNSSDSAVNVSLGTHADVMIGGNDSAPISRRIDTIGNTYGLTMKDGGGTQLCVLFGSGLVGVNAVSDYWFGQYSLNRDPSQMVGNYSSGSNYMVENGSYDSGMGWCWKDRTIPANSSVDFSYLIGVGEVNLEPNSSFEVTPDDPEGWNDLSRPHRLTLEGEYESPAGQNGKIEYAVEDSEEWIALTDELESGSSFTASLVAMFNPELPTHTIRFRTVDAVGNTSMLTPITYKDVSFQEIQGIENKTYNWGDSIMQTSITCDLMSDQYEITNYRNNVNAGIASFNIEGVFPYTIGRKTYNFNIEPLALSGNVEFADATTHIYSGSSFTPEWYFTYDKQNALVVNQDYNVMWKNNVNPGTATLQIQGINNFSGTLQSTFLIDKAQLRSDLYTLHLPSEDITFDNETHSATCSKSNGVGDVAFYYAPSETGELLENAPSEIGKYDIYVEIADGTLYYGLPLTKVGSFTIFQFDEADWATIQAIVPALTQKGWNSPWDITAGISSASSFEGLIIEAGHVVGVNLEGQGLTGTFPVELLSFNGLKSLDISYNAFDGALETILAYANQNPAKFANIGTLDISGNGFSGNIGAFAAAFPALTSLDASNNHVSDVYPMISSRVSNLNLEEQSIDKTVEIDLSNLSVEALTQQIPTILLYNHIGQSYNKPLRLKCTAADGWNVVMTYGNGQINFADVSEQNAYYGNSGDILDVTAMSSDGYSNDAYLSMKLDFDMGDTNFNGKIDILDLQSTILYAFSDYPSSLPFNFTAADTYIDNLINVQDVVSTVNLILNTPVVSRESTRVIKNSLSAREDSDEENMIWIEDGRIMIKTGTPIAAMSIDISTPAEIDLSKYGMNVSSNGMRTIAYSLTRGCIPEGISEIGSCQPNAQIVNITLSTDKAQLIGIAIKNNVSSSIDEVISDKKDLYEIYTPEGLRIPIPQKGINIIKYPDNRIKKIYVR